MKIKKRSGFCLYNRIHNKMNSQAGESIGETLVALLISALALMMLAGAISSAANVITKSNRKMAEYYKNDGALVEKTSGGKNTNISISGTDVAVETRPITYFKNDTFEKNTVVAYTKQNEP